MRSDRELEEMLDAALTSYVVEEPEPELSYRVLAQTRQQERRWTRRWYWLAVAPALACMLIAMVLFVQPHGQRAVPLNPPNLPAAVSSAVPAEPQQAAELSIGASAALGRVCPVRSRGPRRLLSPEVKEAQFPSPAPLTPAELSLLRLATEHPREAAEEIAMAARQREPIETPPIHIEPLQIAPLGQDMTEE